MVAPSGYAARARSPWVGFGDAPLRGGDETREVVVPPFGAAGPDPIRNAAVDQPNPRPVAVRDQRHLDGRRAGRHSRVLRFPSEREDNPRGGSTSTYSPRATSWPVTSIRKMPPGRASSLA